MNKQKGFTLVELLVVIAIIAILAGAVLLAINPLAMMQKSRDATRLSDMDTIRNAINLALTENELILTAGTSDSATGTRLVNGTGYVSFSIPVTVPPLPQKTGLARYIPVLPVDPTNSGNFVYTFQATATDFELNAVLEFADNAVKMTADGGNDDTRYEVGSSLTVISPAL